jgi:lipid A oxidase
VKKVLFLLLLATPAAAQFNISGYVGGARTQNSDLFLERGAGTQVTFQGVSWRGRSFDGPLYYGFRTGYFFHPNIGIQSEFIHMKIYAETEREVQVSGTVSGTPVSGRMPMNTIVQRFNISHGLNVVLFSVVGRHHLLKEDDERLGRVMLTGRFGFGPTIPHPEITIQNSDFESYAYGGTAIQLAGGAEYRLWRKLYFLTEYKFTRTRQDIDIGQNSGRTLVRSHHGVFGLSLHL